MILDSRSRFSALVRALCILLLGAMAASAQAAKFYYGNEVGEVSAEEKAVPAEPRPVQLLFEFQRDGAPNAKATKQVKPWAIEDLRGLGAFAEVVEAPTTDGAVLSIKFNNVVDAEELKKMQKQAFGAGLSFGLFGGVVSTDHYVVTLEYIPATGAEPVTAVVSHDLYMKFGKKDVEIPGTQAKNAEEAVKTVVRQALARGVNDIFVALDRQAAVQPAAEQGTDAPGDPAVL